MQIYRKKFADYQKRIDQEGILILISFKNYRVQHLKLHLERMIGIL
jgi:hypothetical protein